MSNVTAAAPVLPVNSGDSAWMLTSCALVLLMTVPGLALFYGGLVNRKNVVNMMAMSLFTALIITIEWVLWGYSLALAPGTNGMGDFRWGGLKDVGTNPNPDYSATIPHILYSIYQLMFAIITPALISGAVVGRMKLGSWCVFVVVWHVIVYDFVAHMVWSGWSELDPTTGTVVTKTGWLRGLGAVDFAGGTVVHITSGFSALAASFVLGKRKIIIDNPEFEDRPYNIGLVLTGTGLLWVGWFGFNAGSALTAGPLASVAFANTTIAPAAAGFVWFLLDLAVRRNGASLVAASTGVVIGLVAITPGAGYVVPGYSIIIGGVTAAFGYGMLWLKRKLQAMGSVFGFDDTLDAFAVHGMGGALGSFFTGLFATKSVNPAGVDGAFYGNPALLGWQMVAILITIVISFGLTGILLGIMKAIPWFGVRATGEEEFAGLDRTFHKEIIDTYDFADATEMGASPRVGRPKILDQSNLAKQKVYKTREEEDAELYPSIQKRGFKGALTRGDADADPAKKQAQPGRNIMDEISTDSESESDDDENATVLKSKKTAAKSTAQEESSSSTADSSDDDESSSAEVKPVSKKVGKKTAPAQKAKSKASSK